MSPSAPKAHRSAYLCEASPIGTSTMGGEVVQRRVWADAEMQEDRVKKAHGNPPSIHNPNFAMFGLP